MTEPAGIEPKRIDDVGAFVADVESSERRQASTAAALLAALPLLLLGVLLLPWWTTGAITVLSLGVVVAAVRVLLLDQGAARRRGVLALRRHDPRLGDELAAWDEARQGARSGPMVDWLHGDLAAEVRALPLPPRRLLARDRLGLARYLVPIVVALLVVWLCLPILPPLGLAGGGGGGGGGAADGRGRDGPAGSASSPSDPQSSPSPPPPPEPEPEPPPEPDPPAPEPPAPLLDLPSLPRVVVPEFIGDGPTRRALAERVSTGDGPGGAAATAAARGGDSPSASSTSRTEFERAQERALQSRHVPDGERAVVRRYFELLLDEVKK